MNILILSGRLTKEPTQKEFSNKTKVTNISIAHNSGPDKVDFFDIRIWGDRGDIVMKNFHKGDYIEISGYLTTNTYQDNTGVTRKNIDIIANTFNRVVSSSANRAEKANEDFSREENERPTLLPPEEEMPF